MGVIRLALETLWDDDKLTLEERDEFQQLLNDPQRLASMTALVEKTSEVHPRDGPGPIDEQASPQDKGGETSPAGGPSAHDLSAKLAHAIGVALASPTAEFDVARHLAGLEWLIDLDPGDSRVWFHYGRLLASSQAGRLPGREPRGHGPQLAFHTGRLQGLAESGDEEAIVLFGAEKPDVVQAAVREHSITDLPAVLHAYLRVPREAARLLPLVREPFEGWREYVHRLREEAAAMLVMGRGDDAEILLQAVEERLFRWAAMKHRDSEEMTNEAGAIMVLRAGGRRRRKDFIGALRLLRDVEIAVLDVDGRLSAEVEWAMATAEISRIEELGFPAESERAHLCDRLGRARQHLEQALERDPVHLEANLLLGMHTYFGGDDDRAARHFGLLGDRLIERPEWQDLARAVAFHRGLARLRQLNVGTDEGAYHEMVEAIADGYVPTDDELVAGTVALEAHGSPRASDFLARSVALEPHSPAVVSLAMQHSRIGDPTAATIAEELATDTSRRLVERFELLHAALTGAEARADAAATTRLVGRIEDVVARANSRLLDEQWADLLGTGDTLRAVLDPAIADAMRIEVLRRIGRLDEARSAATALFYRAAAGTVRSLDAFDLLELLRELGLAEEELDDLARLVHDEPFVPEQADTSLPASVIQAVEWAAERCPHLVLLDAAFTSAAKSPYRQPGRLWQALLALEQVAAAWERGELVGGFRTALAEMGFDYGRALSAQAVGRHPHEYERTYNGRRVTMGPHLRLGRGSPEACCRIYLYLDETRHLCVVGHVGSHLSDSTTG